MDSSQFLMRVAAPIIAFLFVDSLEADKPPQFVKKEGGYTYLGNYEPRNPKSLNEVPERVRNQVVSHLKARLGDEFYTQLRFTGGQIVDFGELRRLNPNSKNYQWEVHAFELNFEFRNPDVGIKSYTAQIRLRQNGSILEEIDLPAFGQDPRKLHITSLSNALEVARNKGFNPRSLSVEIGYDKKKDILVWRFSQMTADDGVVMKYKNIEINAHTNKIVHEYNSTGIR